MGQSIETLPPDQRAQRYREMADAALLKVKHLKGSELRAEYLNMAAAWHALAQEIETDTRRLAQLEASQERLRKIHRKDQH